MRRALAAAAALLALAASGRADAPACLSESFDGATPPALPAGWVAWNALGPATGWQTSAAEADTAPNAVLLAYPASGADERLQSPPIPVTSAHALLSWRQSFLFQLSRSGVDGGVLEIAVDGDAFHDVTEVAGANLVTGGYTGSISGGPLDGRLGWVGGSGGWTDAVLDLGDALAGHSIVLRWRMGTGGGDAGTAWSIDTLALVQTCVLPLALHVDEQPLPDLPVGVGSNGVLEPGETVVVDPVYQALGGATTLFGSADAPSNPVSIPVSVPDAAADYGDIAAGAAADCYFSTGNCYVVSLGLGPERNGAHVDQAFDETLSNGIVWHWRLHIGETFDDVSADNLFYRSIETLVHHQITGGCQTGSTYCPNDSTLRQQMAVFLLRSRFGIAYQPPPCSGVFQDVPCPGHFTDWIEDLYRRGIAAGCGAGPVYCPGAAVTRQQMAVFLLKTLKGSGYVPAACAGVFADVPCSSPFAPWIEDLAGRQITGGCGGGNYCPTNPNTRGQMAVFLTRTFGLQLYGP